ncbi:hypothetical protein ACFRFL_11580 [Streptomyces sp. NPDC056708]|uniref:hypothetical protein n=1 Tax=unclassified Streptomyces TaxID=2593676 RepID=UPI003679BAEA
MSSDARLTGVETDSARQPAAAEHLGTDPRTAFEAADADTWLDTYDGPPPARAYVDCRPGRFHRLNDLFDLLDPAVTTLSTTCCHHPHGPATTSPASTPFSHTCPIRQLACDSGDMGVRGTRRNPHLTDYRGRHVRP